MLITFPFLPDRAQIMQLLCSLYFMKVYSTENDMCSTADGTEGVIDPKTFHRQVWLMIHIAELKIYVVSENLILV